MKKIDKQVKDHYARFGGETNEIYSPKVEERLRPGSISILESPPSTGVQDWAYATIGLSRYPMPYPSDWAFDKPERRIELFFLSKEKSQDVVELLTNLAIYPFYYNTFFDQTHTIAGDTSVVRGTSMTDILLLPPYFEPEEFGIIHIDDSYHVKILWIVPIYRSEREFIRSHNLDAFEELLNQAKADTSDFLRLPVA